MATTLTVKEWESAYALADEDNAFSCLARDWHVKPRGGLWRLQGNDIRNAEQAAAVAEECREAIAMIRSGSVPSAECDPVEDMPRLVALLQLCEEYPMPMKFDDFRATGTDVADLFSVSPDDTVSPESSGRVYVDCLTIEDTASWKNDRFPGRGRWYVIIGRSEYRSDDLEVIERKLYEFALSEGMTT